MNRRPDSEFFIRRSWPLRQLGADGRTPTGGIASACIADYGGNRWLLSVAHAVQEGEPWGVELGFDTERRETKLWRLGAVGYAALGKLGHASVRTLDLIYVKVPGDLMGYQEEVSVQGEVLSKIPREIAVMNFEEPDAASEFGFAGNVQPSPEKHGAEQQLYLFVGQVAYGGLQFTGMEDEFAIFEMPGGRPDDCWLKGTSGAPILNHQGEVVALVCSAGPTISSIRAIGMRVLRPLLDTAAQL